MAECWGYVSDGILMEIAKRVPTHEDFGAIRGVNHHWRSSLTDFCYSPPAPLIPWLMLPPYNNEVITNENGDEVEIGRFYNLTSKRVCRFVLPEQIRKRRCISSRGWLLTVCRRRSITLFNLFSGRVIYPPYIYLDDEANNGRFLIEKFALSSSPSSKEKEEEDYILMMIYSGCHEVAVWSAGACEWTEIDIMNASDVIYSNGIFYVIEYSKKVHAYSVEPFWDEKLCKRSHRIHEQFCIDMEPLFSFSHSCKNYLVWSNGKLLAINRESEDGDPVSLTSKVWMVELNLQTMKAVPIKDLGNRSLFLGNNESLSLEGMTGCMPNSLYFTDDEWASWLWGDPRVGIGDRNMGVFNLTDESFTPYYHGASLSHITPPLWV